MYIISLLISAYSIYDLRVISPIEIALLVPDGILLNFADFGHIPYNSMIKAELVAYEQDICQSFSQNLDYSGKILLAQSSLCRFDTMAHNAQQQNAIGLIINSNKISPFTITMIGEDEDVEIWMAIIRKEDAVQFQGFQQAQIEIDLLFESKTPTMFDLSIYPDKVKTYEALYEYIEAIAYLDFQQAEINLNYPIFDISQCKNNCDDKRDCSGQYCTIFNEQFSVKSILTENLASICVLNELKQRNDLISFINYIKRLLTRCSSNFNDQCIIDLINDTGIELERVQQCVNSSFNSNGFNIIIDNMFQRQQRYKQPLFYPSFVINESIMKGYNQIDFFNDYLCQNFSLCFNLYCSPDCPDELLLNETCDYQCNTILCDFDRFMCQECDQGCYNSQVSNSYCDQNCLTQKCNFDNYSCCDCEFTDMQDQCNEECNNQACGYDKGRCIECSPNCFLFQLNNGVCDDACYTDECDFDGEDCKCQCDADKLNNEVCDQECNNKTCNYDGRVCIDEYINNTNIGQKFEEESEDDEAFNKPVIFGVMGGIIGLMILQILIRGIFLLIFIKKYRLRPQTQNISPSLTCLNPEQIEKVLPELIFHDRLNEVGEPTCSICLTEQFVNSFVEDDRVRKTQCRHLFHLHCIDEWLGQPRATPSCPNCNENPMETKNLDILMN